MTHGQFSSAYEPLVRMVKSMRGGPQRQDVTYFADLESQIQENVTDACPENLFVKKDSST